MGTNVYLMDTLDTLIREELPSALQESLPKLDPVFNDVVQSSQQVVRTDIGRQWKVNHHFVVSVSGLINGVDVRGGQAGIDLGDGLSQTLLYDTTAWNQFPSVTNMPHVATLMRTMKLQCHHGNFGIPTDLLKTDALNATAIKQVMTDIKGVAELKGQMEAVSFYMPSNGALASFAASAGTQTENTNLSWELESSDLTNTRIRWWRQGMMVDVYEDSGDTQVNVDQASAEVPLVVDKVDYLAGTVRLTSANGSSPVASACGDANNAINVAAGTIYVRDNYTYKMGFNGLEGWLKATGILFGADTNDPRKAQATITGGSAADFTITNYPQFKSYVDAVNGPLTEETLNEKIGTFIDAYSADLDTIITTRKVTEEHLKEPGLGGRVQYYERTGQSLKMKSGWSYIEYEYEGRPFRWLTSPYCTSGYLYVIKMGGGNIKRYVPPSSLSEGGLGSPGSGLDLGSEVEFVAPIMGSTKIWLPVRNSSGALQPMAECPFQQWAQIVPEDVRGIKLTGITEAGT